jgi:hypothetical protein
MRWKEKEKEEEMSRDSKKLELKRGELWDCEDLNVSRSGLRVRNGMRCYEML